MKAERQLILPEKLSRHLYNLDGDKDNLHIQTDYLGSQTDVKTTKLGTKTGVSASLFKKPERV